MMHPNRWITILVASLMAAVVGCQTSSPRATYYTLNALDKPEVAPALALPSAIGIGPLVLPAYLDRLQIVTRPGPNRLRVNDFHRWAGPLQADMLRVVGENLKTLTGSQRIVPYPWPLNQRPDISVSLDIHAFEGIAGDRVVLRASISLRDLRSAGMPFTWDLSAEQPATIADYDSLVAAQSRVLADLSRAIAQKILALRP